MKKTLFTSLAALVGCSSPTTSQSNIDDCLQRNLYDIEDSVDNADNIECGFTYTSETAHVDCPASFLDVIRDIRYTVYFNDENNSLLLNNKGISLICNSERFEIKDDYEVDDIQEIIRMKLSFLPMQD